MGSCGSAEREPAPQRRQRGVADAQLAGARAMLLRTERGARWVCYDRLRRWAATRTWARKEKARRAATRRAAAERAALAAAALAAAAARDGRPSFRGLTREQRRHAERLAMGTRTGLMGVYWSRLVFAAEARRARLAEAARAAELRRRRAAQRSAAERLLGATLGGRRRVYFAALWRLAQLRAEERAEEEARATWAAQEEESARESFCERFGIHPAARMVNLGEKGFSASDVPHLRAHFPELVKMEVLLLNNNPLGDDGVVALAAAIAAHGPTRRRLMWLGFDRTGCGIGGARAVGEMLRRRMPALVGLYLQRNEIGDAGAGAIAAGLAHGGAPKMKELWLARNRITGDGKRAVRDAWERCGKELPRHPASTGERGLDLDDQNLSREEMRNSFRGSAMSRTPSSFTAH